MRLPSMADPVPAFVERLRRAIAGKPIARIAREAGVDRHPLKAILAGEQKHGPYLATVEALARALGAPPGELGFGPDDGGG